MLPVKSGNIHAIGYEGTTLKVQFKDREGKPGAIWSYHDVPGHVHRELIGAESIGGYFAREVRGKFTGKKHEAG